MSGQRGKRVWTSPLHDGVRAFRDNYGPGHVYYYGGKQHEKRNLASKREIESWMRSVRTKMDVAKTHPELVGALNTKAQGETLAQSIARYLDGLPHGDLKTLEGRRRHAAWREKFYILNAWKSALGHRVRASITVEDINKALARMAESGGPDGTPLKPQTLIHRRRGLISLYRTLDGRSAPCPPAFAERPSTPQPQPRALPWEQITHVFNTAASWPKEGYGWHALLHGKALPRLLVITYTGLPPSLVEQIEPAHLSLQQPRQWKPTRRQPRWFPTVQVMSRAKGKGATARTLPLVPEAVAAFKMFASRDAFGHFCRANLRRAFRLYIAAAAKTWDADEHGPWRIPASATVYQLRHSFLTRMYEVTGGKLAVVGRFGVHSGDSRITARYAMEAITRDTESAVESWGSADA